MKLGRIFCEGRIEYVKIENDTITFLSTDPLQGTVGLQNKSMPLSQVKLLAPVQPGKIIAVGVNYRDHAAEMGDEIHEEEPILFLKPPSALLDPQETILRPKGCKQLDYEGEVAVVIGKKCHDVSREEAMEYVLGFTCANDVTARDIQRRDGQWTRGKGFDTFCPLGPWIETEFCWQDAAITTRLNGNVCQHSRTSHMIAPIDRIVSYVSSVMTLLPGDVILTGTPEGVGPMQSGDRVEVEIENLGILKNMVGEAANV